MRSSKSRSRSLSCSAVILAILMAASAPADAAPRRAKTAPAGLEVPEAKVARDLGIEEVYAVSVGFQLAFRKVREPQCNALFARLDFNGPIALALTSYSAPRHPAEQALCDRGVHAVTRAGQREVRICSSLRGLTREGVAAILIHEALHTAGLGEYPEDPRGLTSAEITRAVLKACSSGGK